MMETDWGICNGCDEGYEFIVDHDTGYCHDCPHLCGRCRRIHSNADGCKPAPKWRSVLAERSHQRTQERIHARQTRSEGDASHSAQ